MAEAKMNSLVNAKKESIHVRDLLQDLSVEVQNLMIADVLTKGLGKTKHAKFCATLLGDT